MSVRTDALVTAIVGGAAIVGLEACATAVKMCTSLLGGWSMSEAKLKQAVSKQNSGPRF